MAKVWMIPGYGDAQEEGSDVYMIPGYGDLQQKSSSGGAGGIDNAEIAIEVGNIVGTFHGGAGLGNFFILF